MIIAAGRASVSVRPSVRTMERAVSRATAGRKLTDEERRPRGRSRVGLVRMVAEGGETPPSRQPPQPPDGSGNNSGSGIIHQRRRQVIVSPLVRLALIRV